MTELHGLNTGHMGLRGVVRAVERRTHPREKDKQKQCAKDAEPGDGVGALRE